MCTCASCSYTYRFHGWAEYEDLPGGGLRGIRPHAAGGFANWPSDEPKGAKASAKEYADHWRHCNAFPDHVPLEKTFPQRFKDHGVAPIARNVAAVNWNAGRVWNWQGPILPGPSVRPIRNKAPELLSLARQLREQAKAERQMRKAA